MPILRDAEERYGSEDDESYVSDEEDFVAAVSEFTTDAVYDDEEMMRHMETGYVLSLWEFGKVPRKVKQVLLCGKNLSLICTQRKGRPK